MWKAAFSGRSETGSSVGRSSSSKKKTTGSTTSRRSDDERRKAEKSSRGSTYGDDSVYGTAPSSRAGEPRALTESAVRALDDDDEGWEDEDKDARSERRSVRSDGRKHRRRSEKERSRSRSRDRNGKRKSSSRKSQAMDEGDERAIPDMGSFEQFPGQYAGGVMGPAGRQEPMMSGALPTPDNQFGVSRADSYGAAADYYLDEGQSVSYQPGYRAKSPNMLANPDLDHLMAPTAQENPAQDTGHGSAADFYSGKVSPVLTAEPQSYSSSSGKPSKPGKNSALGTAAAATAAGAAAIGATGAASSYYSAQSQQSTSYSQQQSTSSSSGRPSFKPNRQTTDPQASGPGGGVYYAPPSQQQQGSYSNSGPPGKQTSSQSNSNAGLYAAGAAAAVGAAGLAAYEINQHNQQHRPSMQSSISPGAPIQSQFARPSSYGPNGPQTPQQQMNGVMGHEHYHEHKGPLTRLKDGIFNLISSEEDTIKMEMYTEYIGVCKYCFDPRSSPYDAPRRHHYHATRSRDSFEDLRKRKSIERMRRRSREGLAAAGSARVDKDSRYYSDRRKSSSKTDLVGAGLAAAGVAAGANALFNSDSKNFDDTYSVKSGHRESSAVRRQSRSSSRERRRRSSHGVVGRDGRDSKDEYVIVRTKDGRTERQRVRRSRSRSGDRKSSMLGTAAAATAGAALGATAISAAGRSRHSRDQSPNGTFVRKSSRRSSSSSSNESRDGIFGGFFSPPTSQRKRRSSNSKPKRERKQRGGFFSFGNDSAASSDSDLAFGASRTDLSLKRKNSTISGRNARRKNSDEHIAATVAGIGATAAALAAAQKGQKVPKRPGGVQLGAKRDVKYATPSGRPGQPVPVDDEWEDELPSDVDDASSVGSDLAFGDDGRKLSRRQSRESIGSQSSGAGGLSAWGWRWGGKDSKNKKRRDTPSRPAYPTTNGSGIGSAAAGVAAGALAGAALDSYGRPTRTGSIASSGTPQQPLQYVDPRPMSDAGSLPGSRHPSMPGAFDSSPPVIRPGPGPIQHPKPVAPIQPAFTSRDTDFDTDRPKPRRTQSSPVQSNFAQDAALIGAAAVGTAAVIASQRRKSKDVRFGFTEEQERKHDAESRREEQARAEEERRRKDRERDLKREAERHAREQDVLRAREEQNRRAAEAELEKQRVAQREAEEQAEKYRQLEREKNEREESFKRERERREQRERELTEEIERRKRELEDQKRRDSEDQRRRERDQRAEERRQYDRKQQDDTKSSTSSSVPWGAVAAGAAVAGVGAVALAEHERDKDQKRGRESRTDDRDRYSAREIRPSEAGPGKPITDDDINDREYFNSASRSRSPDHARHVEELARKAADKVVSARAVLADNEARYNDHQSQAEYFAPEEISHSGADTKTKTRDSDSSARGFTSADIQAREKFDEEYAGLQSGRTKYAPYGVPKLNLVSPTPPPSAMKRASTPPASRTSRSEDKDSQAGEGARKSSRSRSISWGVDQTHVYDVVTPESHHDTPSRDSYIEGHDVPTAAAATAAGVAAAAVAGVALNDAVKDPGKSSSRDTDTRYNTREFTPSWDDKDDAEDTRSQSQKIPPIYQQPFYESVSDIGINPFKVDSPGTEGAPPVQGFVEGEVADPAGEEEDRAPHIPGGFDDDYDMPPKTTPNTLSRDVSAQAPAETVSSSNFSTKDQKQNEPAWEPPLSKKEKKKRDKAAKRGESTDDAPSFASVVDAATKANDTVVEPQEDPDAYLSKKDKKKRDKALKRGMSEEQPTTSETVDEPQVTATRDSQPETTWEPPLSKKEKKKREKEAKKQGFADVAETLMTAGGVAAVASTMTDTSNATSKGTGSKTAREPERDIRDIEPSTIPYTRTPPKESSAMPGGWDSDTKEKEVESPAEAVDPFQFQVHDDAWASHSQPAEQSARSTDTTTPKTTTRDSVKFNEPATSSPLKSEVAFTDAPAEKSVWFAEPAPITNGHTSEGDQDLPSTGAYPPTKSDVERTDEDRPTRTDYKANDRNITESPRRISPDDLRSVTSDPTGDRGSKRRSKEARPTQYYAEPDEYDDARSVAASEPADVYGSSRKSKRRSRHEDDDTASVTSSRSKRDREDTSSAKKAGFFGGLFGRKSTDTASKSDGAPLSRQSTKDSKDGDAEDGERRHRRRKHRSTSDYGDDDDTRSVTSASSSRRHRARDDLDEYEAEKRESRRYDDEGKYDRDGESDLRYHHRRRTDDGDYTSGHRHHRSRTEEDSYDQDQSFLGMRVEGMPPLPDKERVASDSAMDKQEQGDGNLVSADRDTHLVSRDYADAFELISQEGGHEHAPSSRVVAPHTVTRDHADAFDLIAQETGHEHTSTSPEVPHTVIRDHANAFGLIAHEADQERGTDDREISRDDRQRYWDDDVEYLPALPDSRPESPTGLRELDASQRPGSSYPPGRVPIRFPFGNQPPTPGHRTERSISFGGSLPTSPASPMSSQKPRRDRPASTEIRPLYLVERNRKTPEVEEVLPSLPSSKPSSRASSMIGSDEYESAAEDVGSPERKRGLTIDTTHAEPEDDYLGSEQTTPRATEFPRNVFDKPPRSQPQFYTWEDFARDERLRRASAADQLNNKDLPELPPSRPESRIDSDDESSGAAGLAAAAAVGGAAVLGYHALNRSRQASDEDEIMHDADREAIEAPGSRPLTATLWNAEEEYQSPVAMQVDPRDARDIDSFVDEERTMEEGSALGPVESMEPPLSPKTNHMDRFFEAEEQMEDGEARQPPAHPDAMDIGYNPSLPPTVIPSAEYAAPVDTDAPHSRGLEDQLLESHPVDDGLAGAEVPVSPIADTPVHEDVEITPSSEARIEDRDVSMEDGVDQFMATEDQLEAGEASDVIADPRDFSTRGEDLASDAVTSSILPGRGVSAASVPEDVDEAGEVDLPASAAVIPEDGFDEQFSPSDLPKLTRKQSKKAKKKEKSASKRKEVLSQPSAPQDDNVVDDSADIEPVATTSEARDMPTTRALSTSSGSGVAAIMSDMMRRGSGNQDTGLKSGASTETSANDATVQTSLDTGESSAERHLEANIATGDNHERDIDSQSQQDLTSLRADETEVSQEATENPVLQPEQEDPWETSTTVSRKQSKKNKKKQQRRQQLELESESQPEVQSDLPELNAFSESRGISTALPSVSAVTEEPVDLISSDAPIESKIDDSTEKPFDVDDTSAAAEVPLPPGDDTELEVEETDPTLFAPQAALGYVSTTDAVSERAVEDRGVDSTAETSVEPSTLVDSEEMDLDPSSASYQPTASLERSTAEFDQTTPMQVDDNELIQPADTAQPDARIDASFDPSATSTAREAEFDPAPTIEGTEEQDAPATEEPEEEFTWSTSKKKGKKGKKGKKSATATPPVTEPQETSTRTYNDALESDPVPAESSGFVADEQTREVEDPGSFWEAQPSKKKKGKKGKRASITPSFTPDQRDDPEPTTEAEVASQDDRDVQMSESRQAVYFADDPVANMSSKVQDLPTVVEPTVVDALSATQMEVERAASEDLPLGDPNLESADQETTMPHVEIPPETGVSPDSHRMEDNVLRVPSMIEGEQVTSESPEPSIPDYVAPDIGPTEAPLSTREVVDQLPEASAHDDGTIARDTQELTEIAPSTEVESAESRPGALTTEDPSVEPVVERTAEVATDVGNTENTESFWAPFTSTKKGKKGKKGKTAQMQGQPDAEFTEDTPADPSADADITDRSITEPSSQTDEAPKAGQEDEPMEYWPIKTKGKKGKKSKKSALSTFEPSENQDVGTDSTSTPAELPSQLPGSISEPVPRPIEPAEAEPDDSWAAPVKGKKGKKGKKNKRASTLDVFEQPTITDQSDTREFDMPVEATDDVEAIAPDQTVDESMRDAVADVQPDQTADESLPPLPESPSLPALEDEEMVIDKNRQEDTTTAPRELDADGTFEPMDIDEEQKATAQNDDTSDSVGTFHTEQTLQEPSLEADMEGEIDRPNIPEQTFVDEAAHEQPPARDIASASYDQMAESSYPQAMERRQVDDAVNTPLPEDSFADELQEPESQAPRDVDGTALQDVTTSGAEPNDDFDFAAHVAKGLADSGFDPNLVANDPLFQRRASPPGTVAEADPEEIFTPIKKRKGKKGKNSTQLRAFDEPESEERSAEQSQTQPSDDFNDTIEKTLAGTGFDASLLRQATSSSNDVSSNEIGRDVGEFSFTTSKKKKGKKSKRTQRESEIFADDLAQPEAAGPETADVERTEELDSIPYSTQEPASEVNASVSEEADPKAISSRDVDDSTTIGQTETVSSIDAPSDPSESTRPTEVEAITTREAQFEQPTAHVAMGGSGEMDVDEMDRAYKAFRKNKKKKKRLTASQPDTPAETPMEEYSDPTERAMAGEGAENIATGIVQPGNDGYQPVEETRPTYPAASGGPPANEQVTFDRSRSFEGTGEYSHTTDIVQPAPLSNERSASPSLTAPPHPDSNIVLGSLSAAAAAAATAAGIGSAIDEHAGERDDPEADHRGRDGARSLGLLPNDNARAAADTPSWSFANLENEGHPLPESPLLGNKAHEIARDSGYQEMSSPSVQRDSTSSTMRGLPEIRAAESRESLSSRRSAEPLQISTYNGPDWDLNVSKNRDSQDSERGAGTLHMRTPSKDSRDTPLESTTKNRASYLFQTTPETLKDGSVVSGSPPSSTKAVTPEYFQAASRDLPLDRDTFSPPPAGAMSPRPPLDTIPEEHHAHKRTVSQTDAKEPDNSKASRRSQTPQSIHAQQRGMSPNALPPMSIPTAGGRSMSGSQSADPSTWSAVDDEHSAPGFDHSSRHRHSRQASSDQRSPSVMSTRSNRSAGPFRSPDEMRSYSRASNRSSTPTLRRTSLSGDLRAASRRGDSGSAVGARSSPKTIPFEPPPTPPSNDDEVMDTGASRSLDMSDVYQGYGDAQASQVSPTRPPSMRKRQSMHIIELESRLDQLAAENQALHDARGTRGLSGDEGGLQEAVNARDLQLREKDNEINQMRTMLQPMQDEIARLTEINNGLTEANRSLVDEGNSRYATLQQQHADASRELDEVREQHGHLTSGVRAAVDAEVATALADKNAEIQHLREELDVASEKIRSLQVQIQSTKGRDFLTVRDEDYFDGACQKLCQHVQQWVLRFSKMSDDRMCRLSTDIQDDKVEARLDNAILDGSDVDKLLGDRIKRRDVFMSVVMTMVWEFIFTRYLFGMDREQRQKLKALEKLLAEVGPPRAVAQWRATTLTLLSKRPQFAEQKNTDTEAVAGEIFALLCMLLPPPSNSNSQLVSSLQKVIGVAVDLSIEMRTQRAEYIMLPPLQPEYDTNGDLMRKVHFNASLMNERSGMFSSNEELEDGRAVVKIVLFPLVVKKGDEFGEGEEEIVVCPAQVLVHNDNARGKKIVRVQSGAMEIDDPRRSRQSLLSAQGSTAF